MRKNISENPKNGAIDYDAPDFKKKWAKLCVFCSDPFDTGHEPWDPAGYAHLLPEGVEKLDDLWKICSKHREALKTAALLNVEKADETPF